jgi:putative N-acetyltransferase (TIGR04045 family)
MREIICRPVKNREELLESFALRKEIFVNEQKLFKKNDRDKYDRCAIHIVALYNNKVVGTVRVHKANDNIWFGSRLAVLKQYRGRVGMLLIRKAMEIVKENGAEKFMARIQKKNVPLFKRLKWTPRGECFTYHGEPHQLMEAKLN